MIDLSNASDRKYRQFAVQNANFAVVVVEGAEDTADLDAGNTLGSAAEVVVMVGLQFAPNVDLVGVGEVRLEPIDAGTAVATVDAEIPELADGAGKFAFVVDAETPAFAAWQLATTVVAVHS